MRYNFSQLQRTHFVFAILLLVSVSACKTVDVYEKNVVIPNSEWESSFKPSFTFKVTDTASLYNIYVTLRHTHAYQFNNIWLNLHYTLPGDTTRQQRVDILLADNQQGKWLGTAMDDIYDVWHLVSSQPFKFKNSGECSFLLEQIMRENPLRQVINAGVRVEKVTQ